MFGSQVRQILPSPDGLKCKEWRDWFYGNHFSLALARLSSSSPLSLKLCKRKKSGQDVILAACKKLRFIGEADYGSCTL